MFYSGKELVACREAVDHFQKIVNVIGGEGEKARAKELVTMLTVVPGQDFFKVCQSIAFADKKYEIGNVKELKTYYLIVNLFY